MIQDKKEKDFEFKLKNAKATSQAESSKLIY